MPKTEHIDDHSRTVETATEARQGERGPTILGILATSTVGSVFLLAIVWFVFFKT